MIFTSLNQVRLLVVGFLDGLDPSGMVPKCGDFIVNLLLLIDGANLPVFGFGLPGIGIVEKLTWEEEG